MLHNQVQRLWYQGPMFRHERPQKGRYRQFHQIGVETFGMPGPDIDAELILMTARIWQAMGLSDLELQLNSLGTPQERLAYRDELVAYLEAHQSQLDEDSRRRLRSNPLRILDSKNPQMRDLLRDITEITRLATDDVDDSSENQSALIEIEEYLREGVMLIRDELNEARSDPGAMPTQ